MISYHYVVKRLEPNMIVERLYTYEFAFIHSNKANISLFRKLESVMHVVYYLSTNIMFIVIVHFGSCFTLFIPSLYTLQI